MYRKHYPLMTISTAETAETAETAKAKAYYRGTGDVHDRRPRPGAFFTKFEKNIIM